MPYEDDRQAAEALFNAVQADRQESGDAPSRQDAVPAEENKPEAPVDGSAEEQPQEAPAQPDPEDSFTRIDPDAIPEELRPLQRNLQADYTRKMQALAEERKQFESLEKFGGIEAAAEAVEFVTALATDPNYALQVHEQLTEALTQAGLTPAQASREAARQIDEAVTDAPAPGDDDFGYGVDPALERRLEQMEQRTIAAERRASELDAWREREEEARVQYAMMSEMDRMHADVVNKFNFDEDTMSRVYNLAYSTGGDLRAAAEVYNAMADSIVSEYISRKASVPAPPNISPTGGGDQPHKFTDLNDPELEKLVNQRLAHEAAQGNL